MPCVCMRWQQQQQQPCCFEAQSSTSGHPLRLSRVHILMYHLWMTTESLPLCVLWPRKPGRSQESWGTWHGQVPWLSLGRQFVHKNKFIFIFSLIIYLFIYLFIWLYIYLFMYLFIIIFFSIISFSIHLFIALFMYLFKFFMSAGSWLAHQSFELSSVGGGQPITEGRYCSKF